jgi:hypothetical protein
VTLNRFPLAAICLALTVASPAHAQVSGGLFAATKADTAGRDKLNLQVELSQALQSELPPEFSSLVPRNDVRTGGHSSIVAASADYSRERRSVRLFGNGSTYFQYAQQLERIVAGSQSAQVGASVGLPKQGSLRISQAVAYSPSYLYQLFPASPLAPGDAIPVNPEYRIDTTDSYSYNTGTALTFGRQLGTRVTATAEYRRTDFQDESAADRNLTAYASGATVSHPLSRRLALSGGYGYSAGNFASRGFTRTHRANIGVQYSPPLSATRRAMFRLEVSPSVVDTDVQTSTAPATNPGDRRQYPVQGEASFDYPFHLKWRALASYRHSVDHLPGLVEPVLAKGTKVTLIGLVARRVDVSALGGYATAVSATSRLGQNLTTYTGEARIRYALSRSFALYSEYLYYYLDLAEGALLAPGLTGRHEQHGVRVGFMFFGQPLRN